jgi:K(+)-stimulated pyrophosphate-energized sodium pump
MNPIIKFSTLFGLLAVELSLEMPAIWKAGLSALLFAVALFFVYRSFYGMRIEAATKQSLDKPTEEARELVGVS